MEAISVLGFDITDTSITTSDGAVLVTLSAEVKALPNISSDSLFCQTMSIQSLVHQAYYKLGKVQSTL